MDRTYSTRPTIRLLYTPRARQFSGVVVIKHRALTGSLPRACGSSKWTPTRAGSGGLKSSPERGRVLLRANGGAKGALMGWTRNPVIPSGHAEGRRKRIVSGYPRITRLRRGSLKLRTGLARRRWRSPRAGPCKVMHPGVSDQNVTPVSTIAPGFRGPVISDACAEIFRR